MNSLDQLRIRYRQGLAKDVQALEAARASLPAADARASLEHVAHQLRGSGASYGFPEITECAKRLEQAAPGEHSEHATALLSVLRPLVLEGP